MKVSLLKLPDLICSQVVFKKLRKDIIIIIAMFSKNESCLGFLAGSNVNVLVTIN